MTTYYVAKTGDDLNDGSEANPYLTIDKALEQAQSQRDIVEIIDEGSYNEGDLSVGTNAIIIQHTASSLGRPKIYGTGLAGNEGIRAFEVNKIGPTLKGLEIYGYSGEIFESNVRKGIEIEDCFIHSVPQLINNSLAGVADNINTIKRSILFFEPAENQAINNGVDDTDGWLQIENCLITSSNTSGNNPIIRDYSNHGTASFCTIINRGSTGTNSTIMLSKVINCLLSSSEGYGIASDDQTYNIVCVPDAGRAFRNIDDNSDESAARGEQAITHAQVGFVDGTSEGNTTSVIDNYKLTNSSLALDAGITYNGISVDLDDEDRPCYLGFDVGCFEYITDWSEYTTEPAGSFDNGFVIQNNTNLSSNHKFKYCPINRQAPFSLGAKGPSSLRGRSSAYKVTK